MVTKKYLRRHYIEGFIKSFPAKGRVLEIGSGSKWRYVDNSTTQNIDPDVGADIVSDAEDMSDIKNGSFDTVYCVEVIEHAYEPQAVVDEAYRVLKEGGTLLLSTPFNLEIHAERDFRRFTKYGLEYLVRNFSEVEIHQNGGRFSVLFHFFRTSWIGKFTYPIWNNLGFYLDKIFPTDKIALGYVVIAKK